MAVLTVRAVQAIRLTWKTGLVTKAQLAKGFGVTERRITEAVKKHGWF